MVQVNIRMGSNQVKLNVPKNSSLNCYEFIELVLKKLNFKHSNLGQLSKTYMLYYRINSNEKILSPNENILKVVKYFNSTSTFIIRKKVMVSVKKPIVHKSVHLYESIASNVSAWPKQESDRPKIKEEYLKKILENEILLQDQCVKLTKIEKILNTGKCDLELTLSDYYSLSSSASSSSHKSCFSNQNGSLV
ncbi:unnamed protein product [Brachionus calyciflorus]|uniref:Uncharacterized protein n=1 Tax=Brachionus calyciflorus TaxID=104777 RepID=A0A813M7P8_9BILA|nr:unnamed protein product [Brachionus calyciflorus]